jgi:hypothetical protein
MPTVVNTLRSTMHARHLKIAAALTAAVIATIVGAIVATATTATATDRPAPEESNNSGQYYLETPPVPKP